MATNKLHKDLKKLSRIEDATMFMARTRVNLWAASGFLVAILITAILFTEFTTQGAIIIAASVIGGYMAMNIGANDVANNIGPAVGAKALTMGGALIIAAIFEASGAILAGGEVVQTIAKNIVDTSSTTDRDFVWAMMAALLAAALWINVATAIGAPVSTTHSVVGGVIGAGLVAAGFDSIHWDVMTAIMASWIISPVMGGVLAAGFLYVIKALIIYQADKVAAARRWVPVCVAIMAAAFAAYLAAKGLRHVMDLTPLVITAIAGIAGALTFVLGRPLITRASAGIENRRKPVSALFGIPLIGAAALLSFAHGANDVANAVGPLAAIVSVIQSGALDAEVIVPRWVMLIGALGISIGLLTYGPSMIRMVGAEITRLDPTRAFCVALSAAITVLLASWLGLPVSSTHIAVGGIFGVGFLREYLINRDPKAAQVANLAPQDPAKDPIIKMEKRRLVRRRHLLTIVSAWVVTVPLSASLSALVFLALKLLTRVTG